jgi:chloramphenicol-sensitive protein RarD
LTTESTQRDSMRGLLFGLAAYGWWGFAPVYFKAIHDVLPLEILANRIVWSIVMLVIVISVMRRWPAVGTVVRDRRALLCLSASTILIAMNWYTYIWAVTSNHMIDASLGYFINPLTNVVFGHLLFHERLRRWEKVSVALATIAVLWLTIAAGVVPWIALTLAISFGLYGLVRKIARVSPIEGLAVETALLFPFALAYLIHRWHDGTIAFGHSTTLDLLLLAAGPVTALPLVWFAIAVREMRLSTVGLLQYISPTLQFLLAVVVYHEPFGGPRLVAFVMIWIAVAIYSISSFTTRNSAA